jgi:6-pyruvoyltetrahydropterin/6-carboxytetrahydropterin synthase
MKRDPNPSAAARADRCAGARFELSQRFHFDAAHTLSRKIEAESSRRIHGHTYEAEVTVVGVPDPQTAMVMDLGHLRDQIARVHAMLDHRFLDEVPDLGPPTLENLCVFIARELARAVPALASVSVRRRSGGDRCLMQLAPGAQLD